MKNITLAALVGLTLILAQPGDPLTEIGHLVVEAAWMQFDGCGVEADFCIQNISAISAVFGSTNRLVWWPEAGFRPDRRACTPHFLAAWDRLYGDRA